LTASCSPTETRHSRNCASWHDGQRQFGRRVSCTAVISPHAIQEAIRRGLLSLNHRGADVWRFGDKCNGCRRRQRPKRKPAENLGINLLVYRHRGECTCSDSDCHPDPPDLGLRNRRFQNVSFRFKKRSIYEGKTRFFTISITFSTDE
jgi:hypothetical protein